MPGINPTGTVPTDTIVDPVPITPTTPARTNPRPRMIFGSDPRGGFFRQTTFLGLMRGGTFVPPAPPAPSLSTGSPRMVFGTSPSGVFRQTEFLGLYRGKSLIPGVAPVT